MTSLYQHRYYNLAWTLFISTQSLIYHPSTVVHPFEFHSSCRDPLFQFTTISVATILKAISSCFSPGRPVLIPKYHARSHRDSLEPEISRKKSLLHFSQVELCHVSKKILDRGHSHHPLQIYTFHGFQTPFSALSAFELPCLSISRPNTCDSSCMCMISPHCYTVFKA